MTPIGVVFPTSTEDAASVVSYSADREIPVLPCGGGTSLTGRAVNETVILDFTRYMDDIGSFAPNDRRVHIQLGTVLENLNEVLDPHELKFAPDSAAGDRNAVGGAIGNNSTGAHSLVYGKTDADIEECEVVLGVGVVATLSDVAIGSYARGPMPTGLSSNM